MKSVVMNVIAVVLLTVATIGNVVAGGNTAQVAVIQHKGDMVAVHFEKAEKQVIDIKITNTQSNKVVFSESDKKHQLAIKKYDLSHLPAGTYTIAVKAGDKVFTQTVTL